MKTFPILFSLIILINYNTFAEETEHLSNYSHHFHNNHLAIFSGATSNLGHKSTDFSLGLDYEYRFNFYNGSFGFGLFGEAVFADETELIAGIPIFVHPTGKLKFLIAPAIIQVETKTETNDLHIIQEQKRPIKLTENTNGAEKINKFLIRIGLAYDFHFVNFSFSPAFNTDIMEGKISLVYGINIGYGF